MPVWFCRHSTVSHHWNVNLVQKIPAWLIVQIKSDTKTSEEKTCWAFERRSSGRISWRDLSFYRVKDRSGNQSTYFQILDFWIRSFDESQVWQVTHACRHHILRRSLLARSPVFSVSGLQSSKKRKTHWRRVTQWWSLNLIESNWIISWSNLGLVHAIAPTLELHGGIARAGVLLRSFLFAFKIEKTPWSRSGALSANYPLWLFQPTYIYIYTVNTFIYTSMHRYIYIYVYTWLYMYIS